MREYMSYVVSCDLLEYIASTELDYNIYYMPKNIFSTG